MQRRLRVITLQGAIKKSPISRTLCQQSCPAITGIEGKKDIGASINAKKSTKTSIRKNWIFSLEN